MRTVFGVLSALAAVWSAQAVIGPTFNKDSCTTNSFSTDAYQATPTSDGAWSCINFDVSTTGVATMRIDVSPANEGAELQFIMWNNGRAGGDMSASPADHRWNRGEDEFVYILRAQGEKGSDEVDISGFNPDVFDYSNRTTRIRLSAIRGWTSGARNDGVYAWVPSSSNQGKTYHVGLNLGMNFLQIGHPSVKPTSGSPGSVADFEGVFMWRFVNPNDDSALTNYVSYSSSITPAMKADFGGPLKVGEARTVSDFFLPGTFVNLDIDATFAKVGLPIKGFKVQVEVLGNGVGNITSLGASGNGRGQNLLTEPEGYTFKDATLSKPGAANVVTLGHTGSNSRVAYYNITDYSIRAKSAERVATWDSSANVNTFTADFVGPLDVTGPSSSVFGSVRVRLPTFEAVDASDNAVSSDLYNWGEQSSPFLNVRVTIVRVDMYPMLSELSNKRFRNWDDSEDSGHKATDINNQEPFGLYLLRTDAYWYDGRIVAKSVANLNALTNAGATTITAANSPGCQPLWEIQEVSTYYSTPGNNYGRHKSGWFEDFSDPMSSFLETASFYTDSIPSGLLTKKSVSKIRSNFWAGNYGDGLADYSTTRSLWFLVRISAAPAMTASGLDDCGSNWIEIGSASFEADSAIGQCRASSECMVASADNPNKDQASDSANGAANRFSTCQIVQSIRRGKTVPTTKCVECFSDNQCDGGQYCHTDYGMCTNAVGDNYFCDKSSYDLYGLCREKDTSILGSRCRPSNYINGANFKYEFPGVSTGAVVPGSSTYQWSGQANGGNQGSITAPYKQFVVKGDPKNKDFAQGSNGACGEFRYYNSSAPLSGAFETVTSSDPWISVAGQVRTTLWNGLCVDMGGNKGHRCVECLPGSSFNGAASNGRNPGKVCLNGRSHSARDVDGTVRSYTQDTRASTELGTTMMVVLLILLFWVYMYTEAKRWRIANGKKPMSCCECILCCGACADEGGAKAGDSSKTAPAPASDDAAGAPATDEGATAPTGGDADQA